MYYVEDTHCTQPTMFSSRLNDVTIAFHEIRLRIYSAMNSINSTVGFPLPCNNSETALEIFMTELRARNTKPSAACSENEVNFNITSDIL